MIYLIDDDDIQNLINTRVISIVNDAIEVKAFTSGGDALEILSSNTATGPDLIFLDINMPKMNGWDFLEIFQKEEYPYKVYMLSSSINEKDIQKSQTYPCVNGFVCKPLVVEKLTEILQKEGIA